MTRWTFETNDELMGKVDALAAEGQHDRKQFVNASLTLMMWAIAHIKENHQIASIDSKGQSYSELQMKELEVYRPAPSDDSNAS